MLHHQGTVYSHFFARFMKQQVLSNQDGKYCLGHPSPENYTAIPRVQLTDLRDLTEPSRGNLFVVLHVTQ
jgi:hypothetical protein